jgi:uridylate kinase
MTLQEISALGVNLGVVIGGGNIFRGSSAQAFHFQRPPADQIGMLSTVINGLALQQALREVGVDAHLMSSITCSEIVEDFHWSKAKMLFDQGKVLLFVGGTGNSHFTTDTAAALRASEMGVHVLMKATKVDGVFDKDPLLYPDATHFPHLTYKEALTREVGVMDRTAFAMCAENQIPIHILNIFRPGALLSAILGEEIGSIVS